MHRTINMEAVGAADNVEAFGLEEKALRLPTTPDEKIERATAEVQAQIAIDMARWAKTIATKPPAE